MRSSGPRSNQAGRAVRPVAAVMTTVLVAIVAFLPVVLPGGPAGAQPTATGSDLDERIQILAVDETASEVVLDVAVPSAIGPQVAVADNFAVTDGGRLVDLEVTRVANAADVVLVIDTSGSMKGSAIGAAKAAAASFIEAVPTEARVGLISFGDTVTIDQEPSSDRGVLLAELDGLQATGEETVLWDALLVAADTVAGADGPAAVVVLSDGDDTFSSADPADVVDRIGIGSTVLYAVAIESPDSDLAALEQTVAELAGQFLATTDLGQLDTLYTDIAGRLSNRYRLRFAPAMEGERTVVVSAATDGGGVATARTSIGRGTTAVGPAPTPDGPSTGPAAILNIGDQPTLGAVVSPAPGPLAGGQLLLVGLGSMFASMTLAGLVLARPQAKVTLNAAAGADRIAGLNVRLGRVADRMVSRHDHRRHVDRRLEAAAIDLRPGEFILAWAVATAVAALAVGAVAGPVAGVLLIVVSAGGAVAFLGIRAGRRRARFADQLTETLGIMASGLRAGQSLPRSIELVAAEAPSPTAEEFNRVAFEVRVGRDLTESIRETADRMANPDLEWLAQAVDINRTMGGDLTEILDNVATTIRERRTVARQVAALSAEGRATAWFLIAMPIAIFFFSWWRTPESVEAMLTETLGQALLVGAGVGMVTGALWIRQLLKITF